MSNKEASISRAERRRMMRDPVGMKKLMAANPGTPEFDKLISYGQVIVHEMSEIQQRMSGLDFAPRGWRLKIQEELTLKWNECVEKLEAIQARMEEIEKNNPANEKPNTTTTPASDRESGIIIPE